MVANLLGNILVVVVLVLDVAEYLLYYVLKRHDATRASEFVDNHAQTLLLLQEYMHKLLSSHCFRHEGHVANAFAPSVAVVEHLRTVYVAYYMVDIVLVDNYFGVAAFYEFLHEFLGRAVVHVYGIYLCTWHHAVAYFAVGEVECILEYLDFVVYFVFVLCILYA